MAKHKLNLRMANGIVSAAEIRKLFGLTQQDFATLLGLSTTTVSRWEREGKMPDDEKYLYLTLLERALAKHKSADVLKLLRDNTESDTERVIALVHMGD